MRSAVLASVVLSFAVPAAAAQIDAAGGPSLVIGSDGFGLVAYKDLATLDLKVAHCVDAACSAVTTVTVDSTGDVGGRAAMALRPGGLPAISYVDATNDDLKLALCSDPLCSAATTVVVDAALQGGGVVGQTGSAIGSDGLPLIAYLGGPLVSFEGSLKVAHCENAACTVATVTDLEAAMDGGGGVGLGVAGDGRGSIVFTKMYGPLSIGTAYRHCNDLACTSATSADPADGHGASRLPSSSAGHPSLSIAPDGMPVYALTIGGTSGPMGVVIRRCANTACVPAQETIIPAVMGPTSIAIGADNRPRVVGPGPSWTPAELRLYGCTDATCTSHQLTCFGGIGASDPSLALDAAGQPIVAYSGGNSVGIVRPSESCPEFLAIQDATGFEHLPAPMAFTVTLDPAPSGPVTVAYTTVDGTAQAGVDFVAASGVLTFATGVTSRQIEVQLIDDALFDPEIFEVVLSSPSSGATITDDRATGYIFDDDSPRLEVDDAQALEGSGVMPLSVGLVAPTNVEVTVNYGTVSATAQPFVDYMHTTGSLTFAPGETTKPVPVAVLPDATGEIDETFYLVLSDQSPPGTFLGDPGTATIIDDDEPTVGMQGSAVTEGNAGNTDTAFEVRLSTAYPQQVTVAFTTQDGTATASSDYLATSGTLTFTPGTTSQAIPVPIVGDVTPEPDESFSVVLANPVNALPGDMAVNGDIVDDDWPVLPGLELTHGSALVADFQADPGPTADRDDYRLAQPPFSSCEAVMDAVSGDAAPGATLERIAADGTTVIGSGEPIGTGSARSLRFANGIGVPVTAQYLRVSGASCGTSCGPDDAYRLRVYETTGSIPRFNNSATQITVLILQNTTDRIIEIEAHFWAPGGQRLLTQSLVAQPHATSVLNTASAGLAGMSGTITVTHDGPYGALAGKAVALEPSTGFSFDSPMTYKPR